MPLLRHLIPVLHYGAFLFAAFYLYNWKPWLNYDIGMNAEMIRVERAEIGLPELPLQWQVQPELSKLSANQFWFNTTTNTVPRHYMKQVECHQKDGSPTKEKDLFIYALGDSTAGIIEVNYSYPKAKRKENPWTAFQHKYTFQDSKDPTGYLKGKWREPEIIAHLSLQQALDSLYKKGFPPLPYKAK